MEFAQWLKKHIDSNRISNGEFIERSKISKAMVYLMLQGKRLPTPGLAQKIALALRRDPAEVLKFARKNSGRPVGTPNARSIGAK